MPFALSRAAGRDQPEPGRREGRVRPDGGRQHVAGAPLHPGAAGDPRRPVNESELHHRRGRGRESGGRRRWRSSSIRPPTSRRSSRSWSCSSGHSVQGNPPRHRGSAPHPPAARGREVKRRHPTRSSVLTLVGLAVVVTTGWGALALLYLAPGSEAMRTALAWLFAGARARSPWVRWRCGGPAGRRSACTPLLSCWFSSSGGARRPRTAATGSRRWRCCPTPPSTAIA